LQPRVVAVSVDVVIPPNACAPYFDIVQPGPQCRPDRHEFCRGVENAPETRETAGLQIQGTPEQSAATNKRRHHTEKSNQQLEQCMGFF
jgi:hypothetical protein